MTTKMLNWSKCINHITSYKNACSNSCDKFNTIKKRTNSMEKIIDSYIDNDNLKKLHEWKIKVEGLWKSSITCLSKRKIFRDRCVDPEYRDEGHNKAIKVVEEKCVNVYGQQLLKIVNAINKIVVKNNLDVEELNFINPNHDDKNDNKSDDDFSDEPYLTKQELNELDNDDELIMYLIKESNLDKFTTDVYIDGDTAEHDPNGNFRMIDENRLCPDGSGYFMIIVVTVFKGKPLRQIMFTVCMNPLVPQKDEIFGKDICVNEYPIRLEIIRLLEETYGYGTKDFILTKHSEFNDIKYKIRRTNKHYFEDLKALNKENEVVAFKHEIQYVMVIDMYKFK
jgi:hypothetical protein